MRKHGVHTHNNIFSLSTNLMAETDIKLNDFANVFSLKGKVAVVTGGSRGLGLHAASGSVNPVSSIIALFIITIVIKCV